MNHKERDADMNGGCLRAAVAGNISADHNVKTACLSVEDYRVQVRDGRCWAGSDVPLQQTQSSGRYGGGEEYENIPGRVLLPCDVASLR